MRIIEKLVTNWDMLPPYFTVVVIACIAVIVCICIFDR